MKIVGCDPGRQHTAIVAYDIVKKEICLNKTVTMTLADARKNQEFNPQYYRLDMMRSIVESLIDSLDHNTIMLGAIEDYIYGTRPVTTEDVEHMDRDPLKLAEIHGAIKCAFSSQGIPTIKIAPTQMKLFTTGDGMADKREMIKAVYEKYKVSMPDEHQYDALCAIHIGRYFLQYCVEPQRFQAGSYERTVVNRLMFDKRFEGVADEVRARVRAYLKSAKDEKN